MVLNDLIGDEFKEDWVEKIQMLKTTKISPGEFVLQCMDRKFSSFDLSKKGRMFADAYYQSEVDDNYLKAYGAAIRGDLFSEYLLPDTWQTYAKVATVIDIAF